MKLVISRPAVIERLGRDVAYRKKFINNSRMLLEGLGYKETPRVLTDLGLKTVAADPNNKAFISISIE